MLKPLLLIALFSAIPLAAVEEERMGKLANLSIEDLISIKVVSVSKKEESLNKTAAAIHVITGAEIRRAGVSNFTDALRLVPGVQVAAIGTNLRAVSIRGFNDLHANKLLVLVDGRTIYNHLFSGVFWPQYQLFVEDIDRIEIIRGPGSTLWGANAVNGIINVITKKAERTTGSLLTLAGGNLEGSHVGFRHGGNLPANGAWRAHIKTLQRGDDRVGLNPNNLADEDSRLTHLDTRFDWGLSDQDQFTIQAGGFQTVEENSNRPNDLEDDELYLTTRWQRNQSNGVTASAQFNFERMERRNEFDYETWEIDLQMGKPIGNHDLVFGAGYRGITDSVRGGLAGNAVFDPVDDDLSRANLFVQDQWRVSANTNLILGTKFEYNRGTRVEVLPNLRLFHQLDDSHSLWAAISRAARVPSRVEWDATLQGPLPPVGGDRPPPGGDDRPPPPPPGDGDNRPPPRRVPPLVGNPDFDTSHVTAFEVGYRLQAANKLSLDVTAFYNRYEDLEALSIRPNDFFLVNGIEGHTSGLELSLDWRPQSWWRLSLGLASLKIDLSPIDPNQPLLDTAQYIEASNPDFSAVLRSNMNPWENLELDVIVRHVEEVRQTALPFPQVLPTNTIDAYTVLDIHLAWRINQALDVGLSGRDLGSDHAEYTAYELGPNGYLKLAWRF